MTVRELLARLAEAEAAAAARGYRAAPPETVTRTAPDNLVALAGSLPRAATDDEIVAHRETVDGAPSPEDAILMMIDAKRRR